MRMIKMSYINTTRAAVTLFCLFSLLAGTAKGQSLENKVTEIRRLLEKQQQAKEAEEFKRGTDNAVTCYEDAGNHMAKYEKATGKYLPEDELIRLIDLSAKNCCAKVGCNGYR